jgi:hypothetical protein
MTLFPLIRENSVLVRARLIEKRVHMEYSFKLSANKSEYRT